MESRAAEEHAEGILMLQDPGVATLEELIDAINWDGRLLQRVQAGGFFLATS